MAESLLITFSMYEISKAYAKLHGDYASLEGGNSSEAIGSSSGFGDFYSI
jgi:hypothetical protein